jgi:hypothetical protein
VRAHVNHQICRQHGRVMFSRGDVSVTLHVMSAGIVVHVDSGSSQGVGSLRGGEIVADVLLRAYVDISYTVYTLNNMRAIHGINGLPVLLQDIVVYDSLERPPPLSLPDKPCKGLISYNRSLL